MSKKTIQQTIQESINKAKGVNYLTTLDQVPWPIRENFEKFGLEEDDILERSNRLCANMSLLKRERLNNMTRQEYESVMRDPALWDAVRDEFKKIIE